jgi:hypothetical protein
MYSFTHWLGDKALLTPGKGLPTPMRSLDSPKNRSERMKKIKMSAPAGNRIPVIQPVAYSPYLTAPAL